MNFSGTTNGEINIFRLLGHGFRISYIQFVMGGLTGHDLRDAQMPELQVLNYKTEITAEKGLYGFVVCDVSDGSLQRTQ